MPYQLFNPERVSNFCQIDAGCFVYIQRASYIKRTDSDGHGLANLSVEGVRDAISFLHLDQTLAQLATNEVITRRSVVIALIVHRKVTAVAIHPTVQLPFSKKSTVARGRLDRPSPNWAVADKSVRNNRIICRRDNVRLLALARAWPDKSKPRNRFQYRRTPNDT
ncbi:MAG: hypothetical protein CM15mP120_11520 [Pseudomonadota bacterium]|nr:MAG: hypothetical protein CM15mP120_11520 [Pseudomonadota bacterium]